MNFLFADSSTEKLILGLYKKIENNKINNEIYSISINSGFNHTENLYSAFKSLISISKLNSFEDIENVILVSGPGSFTGVRIIYSFIKGLFIKSDVKFYEVPGIICKTISFIEDNSKIKNEDIIIPLIFGKKKRFFGSIIKIEEFFLKIKNNEQKIDFKNEFNFFDLSLKDIIDNLEKNSIINSRSKFNIYLDNEVLNQAYYDKDIDINEVKEKFEKLDINFEIIKFNIDIEKIFNFFANNSDKILYKKLSEIDPFYLREPDAYEKFL
jgi:hypothetical protein